MLSRIANNLFWIGRYFERSEHQARYCKVQFMSSLDAPVALDKAYVLNSMLSMTGSYQGFYDKYSKLSEHNVFKFTTLEHDNPSSIRNMIHMARENARSVRNLLVSEVWEASNTLYHSLDKFEDKAYKGDRYYDFYQHIIYNVYIIKGIIANTLVRDEMSAILHMGMYMERAIQVSLIILTKLREVDALPKDRLGTPLENFHWTTLLRSAGGFDTSKRLYRSVMNRHKSLEFLLLNATFPKSISFCAQEINQCFSMLDIPPGPPQESAEFMAGKLAAHLKFMQIHEIRDIETEYFSKLFGQLLDIANKFETKYLV
jgi:uncharacterized alpha-E superfamily protein